VKRTTVALLTAAVLLTGAGPANAATRQLKTDIGDANGFFIGEISMTVNIKKGVPRSVTKVKVHKLVPSCGRGDNSRAGDPITTTLKGTYRTKAGKFEGTKVWSFDKRNARGGGFKWRVRGSLNKKGTNLSKGRIVSKDLGGNNCSVSGRFLLDE
jgi:hypothetical protein